MNATLRQENLSATSSLTMFNDLIEQALHDLESPVAAIKVIVDGIVGVGETEKKILDIAMKRLNEIVGQLAVNNSNGETHTNETPSEINSKELVNEIQSLVSEKNIIYSTGELNRVEFINFINTPFYFNITKVDFVRSLSNLINNAIEASDELGKVEVLTEVIEGELYISVRDYGEGIKSKILSKLGSRGATFNKTNGSGLGLYYTKKMIESAGGSMMINSQENEGTEVVLKIAVESAKTDSFYEYVLIDNDELVRLTWEAKAKSLGISLLSLRAPELLTDYLDKISKTRTQIYIDSDLDNLVRGEFVAKALHEKGYLNLFMATGYESSRFESYGFLKCVGKCPPFKR